MSISFPHRRLAAVALAVTAVTLGLSACAGPSSSSDPSSPLEITLWDQKAGDASPVLDGLVKQFNDEQKKYVVKRQFIAGSADQFASQIKNAIRTKDTPNLIFGDSNLSRIGSLLTSEAVADLTPFFGTGDYELEKDDIYPGMLEPSTIDGTIYSLPTDGGAYSLIYNKKTFEEAGITDLPKTWDDVAEAAKKLTTDGKYGIYLPMGADEWTSFTWESMLWSAGGEFLNADNTEAEFNSPAGVEALTAWTDMIADGSAYPSSLADDSQQTGRPGFTAGQIGMFIGRPADLPLLDEALGEGVAGVLPFPEIKEPAMNIGTNGSYILNSTEEENAGAWAFLSWALQPAQQATWDIGTGYLPTNRNTAESTAWKEHVAQDERIGVFSDQLSYARTRPAITQYAAVSSALATQIEKAMLQQITPEEALQTAEEEANAALE